MTELLNAYRGLVDAYVRTGNTEDHAADLAIGTLARSPRMVELARQIVAET